MSSDPKQKIESYYDVIVIGSGLGGLTAASLLARAGKSVLVVESHDRCGGYAHGFNRKRYHFDSGVHLTSGCGKAGYQGGHVIHNLVQAIGVAQQIEFIPVNPFSQACYPGLNVKLPVTIDAFVDCLAGLFPNEAEGLKALLECCLLVTEELAKIDEVFAESERFDLIEKRLPYFSKYRKATLAEVCQQFIQDPGLLCVFATNWPYLGLPPSRVSFIYWATMLIGYLEEGAYYCKGGFQQFANVLVKGLVQNQGQILYKTRVNKIVIEQEQVRGVMFQSGQCVNTKTVISNADMRETVFDLVGEEYFSRRYLQRLNRLRHSYSIFAVYLATSLPVHRLDLAQEVFCYDDDDHEKIFAKIENSEIGFISITIPTLADPGLAPTGEHIVMLTTLLPYKTEQGWKELKPLILQQLLDRAENYLPGLQANILYVDAGSPETMRRYTQNYQGAAYGWDVSPDQVGPGRIAIQSPVTGLFYAGHWTTPGGGVYGVCVSGMQAAKQVLGIASQKEFWQFYENLTKSC